MHEILTQTRKKKRKTVNALQAPKRTAARAALPVALCATATFLFASPATALSQYGRACEYNKSCLSCKENIKCLKCLHNCYNMYGSADTLVGEKLTRDQFCRKTQSKWCHAQCWDPDDTEEDDYVTTKPQCKRAF